jgi:elongation factor P
MLSLNEIKLGKVLLENSEPYIVIKTEHHKVARGGAVLKVKLKNLINNNILEKTFQGNDKAEEAGIKKKKAQFMYFDDASANFMDNETYDQFNIPLDEIGEKKKFLKDGTDVDVLYFEDNPVAVDLPVKMEFKVISSTPGVKGNSAGNVTKKVKIETGTEISAPLFINEGDIIRVNTDTGEYVERA